MLGELLRSQDNELFSKLRSVAKEVEDIPCCDQIARAAYGILYAGGPCDLSTFDSRSAGRYHDAIAPLLKLDWDAKYLQYIIDEVERARLLGIIGEASARLSGGGDSPSKVAEGLKLATSGIASGKRVQSWEEYISEAEAELKALSERGVELDTGIRELDAIYSPRRKNVTVVGAPTSHGKTAFALKMVNRALDRGMKVLLWCLEDWTTIPFKIASQRFGIPLEWYTKYHILDEETRAKADGYLALIKSIDTLTILPEMPYSDFESLAKIQSPDVIVVDYLQRYVESQEKESKREGCGRFAADFDGTCKSLNAFGFLLSQVRRRETKETGHIRRPTLYDLKESGDIENYATSVLMLYWPWRDALEKNRLDIKDYRISVEKDKLGRCGEVECIFDGETQTHRDKYEAISN